MNKKVNKLDKVNYHEYFKMQSKVTFTNLYVARKSFYTV